MSLLKNVLIKASGNKFVQNLLERNVQASQYLMGIGSGTGVQSSGERTIFQLLKQKKQPPYCIFDIGANKGQFLQLALENVSTNDFRIHCFEPGHETFKILSETAKNDRRITLNNIALGKMKGGAAST